MGVGGKERKASGVGTAVKTEAKVKAELVGPERTGLGRDEVFERELGFHWDRSRIFTWMLLAMECMQLARVRFHRFDEFKGAMRELHEWERLERWTVDVGRIELCNDETLLEYLVACVWTLVGQGSGRHGQALTPSGPSGDVGGGANARGAGDARRVFGAPCERLVERMGFAEGEFVDVGARRCAGAGQLSAARPTNPFAGYNPPSGPQQDGQLTAAERQAAADYRTGARAIAAPLQVVVPMSRAATAGESEEEEQSEAAEEEEPPRDPKDRLPSLHRS
ncbi:hypothetical protein DYB26_011219 [Aphanomyces astaci]|uniref:Uncharacterized protein n=1 Tax=Aphanomyces astaci TaxID=112090 RepID=A0A3R7FE84_APHAT|nr:hypothetical protein DYB26_011219 [Aphanomyces astaci]